jgi:hypothetical protein
MKLDPNKIKVRDLNMVAIINGATKAGAHRNHKKEGARKECRRPVRKGADY